MGASLSGDSQNGGKGTGKKIYRPPDVRVKDRYIESQDEGLSLYEAAVDKYDFLLVFRLAEVTTFIEDLT